MTQSISGLQTLAILEIAVPLLFYLGRMAFDPAVAAGPGRLWQAGAMVTVGVATLAVSPLAAIRRHARLLAGISAWAAASLLILASVAMAASFYNSDFSVPSGIALVMLTAVATVPFRPLHTIALGGAIEGVYILSWWFAGQWGIAAAYNPADHLFVFMLTLLATGITAETYRRRRAEFEAAREAVRVAEALTGAQLRAQLAENAISIGKMAATLTHEINSPMGALRSSIDTLLTITDRQLFCEPEKRQKLAETRAQLVRSVRESAARIDDVMARLRRFIHLDEAELKSADINELLTDVTLLHQEELNGRIKLEFEFEPLPRLVCRPQLISSAFSSLLSNAINAVNGDGRIVIATRKRNGLVEVTIRDNGKGMRPEEVETLFDPGFRVNGGRVSSGNWTLFNTRQILYEHGGDIRIESAPGEGTAIHVTLPA